MTELFPALQEAALPLTTFLLGMLVGHRFALWRDRRKDFNQAAQPVLAFLFSERDGPRVNRQRPSDLDLHMLQALLSVRARKHWRAAWQQYEQACQEARTAPDGLGQVGYGDTARIVAAVDRCLALVRLR